MRTKLTRKITRETSDRYNNKVLVVTLDHETNSIVLRPKATKSDQDRSISFSKLYAMLNNDKTQDDEINEILTSLE